MHVKCRLELEAEVKAVAAEQDITVSEFIGACVEKHARRGVDAGEALQRYEEGVRRRGRDLELDLPARAAAVVRYVNEHPDGVRAADLAKALDVAYRTARERLYELRKAGHTARRSYGLYTPKGPK
jgi:hypothetical protein